MTYPVSRVERVGSSRRPTAAELGVMSFGTVFSDHMLVAEYRDGAWGEATVRPYAPLALAPSISALQYGISVFEGLKAHRMPDGAVAMFRPGDSARRLNRSAARLSMPDLPEEICISGLRELLRADEPWVPSHGQGALYIRPTLFSTDESIRVRPAERYLFVAFTCPLGAYYAAPVDVWVTERFVRAFPGGTGDVKPAGNYAPALLADREAQEAGCQTVLWLDARDRTFVEECGVMNVFFVMDDRVVTPSLEGTILPGITRDSVITLLRESGATVEERRIPIEEVFAAFRGGRLRECFGTGTAATLSHVKRIRFRDQEIALPPVQARRVGPAVHDRLVGIATGRLPDRYGWLDRVVPQPGPDAQPRQIT